MNNKFLLGSLSFFMLSSSLQADFCPGYLPSECGTATINGEVYVNNPTGTALKVLPPGQEPSLGYCGKYIYSGAAFKDPSSKCWFRACGMPGMVGYAQYVGIASGTSIDCGGSNPNCYSNFCQDMTGVFSKDKWRCTDN